MTTRLTSPLPTNNFDFLRFAFASLVVLSHSYPAGTGTEAREPLMLATGGQLTIGTLAVDCFFTISGFLILHSWLSDPDARRYLRKRVMRIYPGFLIVAAVDAFVIGPTFSQTGYTYVDFDFVGRFVMNALRLEPLTPGPSFQSNPAAGTVNFSLWSISYEFWCYIGILTLGLVGHASSRKPLAGALIASIAIAFVFAWKQLTPGGHLLGEIFGYPPFWARLLPFFLAGMAFYAYRRSIPLTTTGAMIAIASLVLARWLPYGLVVVLPIAASYLIFWFAFLPMPRLSRFAARGDFSYGIYLYASPLLQIVVYCLGAPIAPPLLFLIGWPITLIFAFMSWHLVEKHCIRLGRSRSPAIVESSMRPT